MGNWGGGGGGGGQVCLEKRAGSWRGGGGLRLVFLKVCVNYVLIMC